ncbi:MAG: hypothetical protein J5725_12020 [Bacteroidales bacterium]|nr:hypothetical protein [Bacteroidales bacterium]
MAVDKLVDSTQLDADLTSVANAIRAKSHGNGQLAFPSGFVDAINGLTWDWKGGYPEFIKTIYTTSFTLGSTSFASWTPSTTAKSIKSASTLSSEAFTGDLTQYEYLLRWRCQFIAVYNTGATLKNQVYHEVADIWQTIFQRPNTVTNITNSNFNYNVCTVLMSTPLTVYYNADGTLTPYFSIAYGIYPSATAASFSSTSSNTPTITPKTPAYNARCSATYFATGRASELDQTNSIIKMQGDLYRIPKHSTLCSMYEGLIYLYNHPLT